MIKIKLLALILLILAQFVLIPTQHAYAFSNPAPVPLGSVTNFAALAHTAITSPTGPTVLNNGDLGVDSGACTGFPSPCTASGPGTLNGGQIHLNDAPALTGQTDATAAVTNIGLRTANQTLTAQIGGQTLTQGVYDVPAAATNLTGDLTLSGDANSVFIFHMTSTFITDNGSRVLLTGGVQACNVYWKVDSSATFNGGTVMVGTVLASTSVTFPGGGATLNGRVVAQTGAITFNNTTINNSSCASTGSSSSSSSSSTSPTATCPALAKVSVGILESRRVDSDSVFISWGPYSGVNTFNVQYGTEDGKWLYNVNVTGFSTTINALPANQPIWVRVAPRNSCTIGAYGTSKLVGGPGLPSTGAASDKNNISGYVPVAGFVGVLALLVLIQRRYRWFSMR
jgi:hypothetical protein